MYVKVNEPQLPCGLPPLHTCTVNVSEVLPMAMDTGGRCTSTSV
jgi:hypothetical protein